MSSAKSAKTGRSSSQPSESREEIFIEPLPHFRGLRNPGNMCSLIALTQVFKSTDFLLDYIGRTDGAESRAMLTLIRKIKAEQSTGASLTVLRNAVARHLPDYPNILGRKGGLLTQQCVAEVFKAVIQDNTPVRAAILLQEQIADKLPDHIEQLHSDPTGTFSALESSIYECNNESCRQQKMELQSQPFIRPLNIDACADIHQVFDGQERDEARLCTACNMPSLRVRTQWRVGTRGLIIHLDRANYADGKNRRTIKFPETLASEGLLVPPHSQLRLQAER